MVQDGQDDHLGQNDPLPSQILLNLVFATPKWTICPFWPEEVHFGPFGSANRTLATPERRPSKEYDPLCVCPALELRSVPF